MRVDRIIFQPAGRSSPGPHTTWQWQLTTPVDRSVEARMFDIDLFDNPARIVAALPARGRRVVCYPDAGTLEPGVRTPIWFSLPAMVTSISSRRSSRWV